MLPLHKFIRKSEKIGKIYILKNEYNRRGEEYEAEEILRIG
jgi:hypothetical protein